jgi:hypothetical protein
VLLAVEDEVVALLTRLGAGREEVRAAPRLGRREGGADLLRGRERRQVALTLRVGAEGDEGLLRCAVREEGPRRRAAGAAERLDRHEEGRDVRAHSAPARRHDEPGEAVLPEPSPEGLGQLLVTIHALGGRRDLARDELANALDDGILGHGVLRCEVSPDRRLRQLVWRVRDRRLDRARFA